MSAKGRCGGFDPDVVMVGTIPGGSEVLTSARHDHSNMQATRKRRAVGLHHTLNRDIGPPRTSDAPLALYLEVRAGPGGEGGGGVGGRMALSPDM